MANHRKPKIEGAGCPVIGCFYILAAHRVPFTAKWIVFVNNHWIEEEQDFWRAEGELLDSGR